MKQSIFLVPCLLLTIGIISQNQRNFKESEFIRDLSEFYETDAVWEQEFTAVDSLVETTNYGAIDVFRNPKELLQILEELEDLRLRVSKVAYCAILR